MLLADIMALVAAGFTKEDIVKIVNFEPAPAPAPVPAPAPAPAPDGVDSFMDQYLNRLKNIEKVLSITNTNTGDNELANIIYPKGE